MYHKFTLYFIEQMFYNPVMRVNHNAQKIDVICQHSRDGTIIPLRIRVKDEDGANQEYTIKGFRDVTEDGIREMPDGVYVTGETSVFECNILSFGAKRTIRLYYKPMDKVWIMTI